MTDVVGRDLPLVHVAGVVVEYGTARRRRRVLHDVSLRIDPGKTLGLVGESGSGKSTLGKAILGLVPLAAGSIHFDGARIDNVGRTERRRLAERLQAVFQDPYGSLDPRLLVGEIIAEPLRGQSAASIRRRVEELLDLVGLTRDAAERAPAEFSGGQRQRIAIARAIARSAEVIVCDEPVSALDLTTQARILDLFLLLQQELGVSYLFISHDTDVVRHISHDVAVLEQGRFVEDGPVTQVIQSPRHPYTRRLLESSPVLDIDVQQQRRSRRLSSNNG
ncbi:MAG: ATP-binding cassette domain-containing protein [Gordonia sp. (in: high G+C Gram-positive bacteria)]